VAAKNAEGGLLVVGPGGLTHADTGHRGPWLPCEVPARGPLASALPALCMHRWPLCTFHSPAHCPLGCPSTPDRLLVLYSCLASPREGGGAGAAPVAQPAFQRRPCCGCTLCALDSPSASAHVQCKQRFVGEGWAGQGTTGGGGRAILPCLHFCQVSCCNFHFHPALIWHARCGRPIRPPQLVCPVVLLRPSCKWAHVCTSQASHEITILML